MAFRMGFLALEIKFLPVRVCFTCLSYIDFVFSTDHSRREAAVSTRYWTWREHDIRRLVQVRQPGLPFIGTH